MCADFKFGLPRLKKISRMLRSDHRELRNSYEKLMWVVVVV